jgi:hypothetical protein
MRISIDWRAAIYSGIVAGIIASMAQIILWWSFGHVVPGMLFRDARLAAAIIMGRAVLPPHTAFGWQVMALATLIHFELSILYGLGLALFITRCSLLFALSVGVAYGLSLFFINMYGFTMLFPWFEAARDWITLVTHAVFGISAAGVYKILSMH